jgi:hypothetical protein
VTRDKRPQRSGQNETDLMPNSASCKRWDTLEIFYTNSGQTPTRQDRSKEQRPPSGVAVFPLYSSTVYSACMHPHRMALCISDRGSSSDRASIVGGALQRIFQPLRDQIDHHIPSCTAVVLVEAHAPNHKAAKALLHRDQVLHLVLKPGRMLAPSRLRAHRRKGADGRKFAEPSDDLHHIACLSSVRACW